MSGPGKKKRSPEEDIILSVYNEDFFKELYKKISLKDENKKGKLKSSILKAANTYINFSESHKKQLSSGQVKDELEKLIGYLKKSQKSLLKISKSFPHGATITKALNQKIKKDYPSLRFLARCLVPQCAGMGQC